jgi:hypothetical protein
MGYQSTFVAACGGAALIALLGGSGCGSGDAASDGATSAPSGSTTHGTGGAHGDAAAGSHDGDGGAATGNDPGNGDDSTGSGGGGGATGGPADLFPSDSPWYRDVSAAPVAAESSGIVSAIGSWGTGKFLIDFSIVFFHADSSTPRQSFTIDWTDESDLLPVPIPNGGAVEGESGYACNGGGDCHLIVVDDSQKLLFELYSATNSPEWHASQETVWNLTKHYSSDGRGIGCTSADAAGLSVMAGLIGVRETKAGDIRHALRFILPNSKIRKGPSYVSPATHGTSATSSSGGPPYGTRLRLRATYDESSIASPGGKAIVRALKKYGMILADGGNYALTAEDDRFEKANDPSMTWEGLLGGSDLKAITPADFDVVDYSAIQTGDDCTRAP